MNILVINGPNLNMLGIREPDIYGTLTLNDINELIYSEAKKLNVNVECKQSNHEGDIVTFIQEAYGKFDGIIINPAAYTHTSVAILDALKAVNIKTIEVHLSKVNEREEFRKISYIKDYCLDTISGKQELGYIEALHKLIKEIKL